MLKLPFDPIDDLIWFTKLRKQGFAESVLSPAWMTTSPFYRPIAEVLMKGLFSVFGLHLTAYRVVQTVLFLVLLWIGHRIFRQLRLPIEASFLFGAFVLGTPFIPGSITWTSELPHVVLLICFAASLLVVVSDLDDAAKLALCGVMFAVGLLVKENGLALAAFSLCFIKTPVRTALVYGGIIAGYLVLRGVVLGWGFGAGGVNENVGYFFDYLSGEQRRTMFAGDAVYKLYAYNVVAQLGALLFRATQWGVISPELTYPMVLQTGSTAIIAAALIRRWRRGDLKSWIVVLVVVAIGCMVFSYSYARDRHLALPGLAYGFSLVLATCDLAALTRSRIEASVVILFAWAAWVHPAFTNIEAIPPSGIELVQKIYGPSPVTPTNLIDQDIWSAARSDAYRVTKLKP